MSPPYCQSGKWWSMDDLTSNKCRWCRLLFTRYTATVYFREQTYLLEQIKPSNRTDLGSITCANMKLKSQFFHKNSVHLLHRINGKMWQIFRCLADICSGLLYHSPKRLKQIIKGNEILKIGFHQSGVFCYAKDIKAYLIKSCAVDRNQQQNGGKISLPEKQTSNNISSDKVLVHTVFDKEIASWKIMSNRYCWHYQCNITVLNVRRSFICLLIPLSPIKSWKSCSRFLLT